MCKVNYLPCIFLLLWISGQVYAADANQTSSQHKLNLKESESREFWDSFDLVADGDLTVDDLQTLEDMRKQTEAKSKSKVKLGEESHMSSTKSKTDSDVKE